MKRRILVAFVGFLLSFWGVRAAEIPIQDRQSGYQLMSPETRAMQDDDAANPGMLWVFDGEALWQKKEGRANLSCADCHGDARQSMKGVAARYPALDPGLEKPIDIEQRIEMCHTEKQQSPPYRAEGKELLALTAYVARQSKGLPIAVAADDRTGLFISKGREIYERRQGQLNLSCANCHEDNWGEKLAGSTIPQALPTGYPLYRLEWQNLGSLYRRLRNCLVGMRAEPYPYGAPEYAELELYLMWRARGMPMEAPGIRP